MTERTDIHRPSAIQPEHYVLVACLELRGLTAGDPDEQMAAAEHVRAERAMLERHMAETGGRYAGHEHGGTCMVCGAHCVDVAVFHHVPTNEYVRTGFDCAHKLDLGDAARFRRFRDARRQAEHYRAGRARAERVLTEQGVSRAWALFETVEHWPRADAGSTAADLFMDRAGVTLPDARQRALDGHGVPPVDTPDPVSADRDLLAGLPYRHACRLWRDLYTLRDVVAKLIRYGDLSDRQYELLDKLVRAPERTREAAERDAEQHAAASPAPSGRHDVTGRVASVKARDTDYGVQYKALVVADPGYKVWTTVPAALLDAVDRPDDLRGARVSFRATLTPGRDDDRFATASRPGQAALLDADARQP